MWLSLIPLGLRGTAFDWPSNGHMDGVQRRERSEVTECVSRVMLVRHHGNSKKVHNHKNTPLSYWLFPDKPRP